MALCTDGGGGMTTRASERSLKLFRKQPDGSVKEFSAKPDDPVADGDVLVLDVVDHGPGIAPEHAERVFERFYRLDDSRARTSGGSGLGLAIVAALVAAHGGTARVLPTAGGGTTVRLTLPAAA